MILLVGTIINAISIIIGGLAGLLIKKGIPDEISTKLQNIIGLLIIIIGFQYGMKADNIAIIAISLALGLIVGEILQIDERLKIGGLKLEKRFSNGDGQFMKGFITASLLYCVGAMAIIGALEDGLTGNYEILLVKSILDGMISIIFAAGMGIGVIFSALPILLYQGSISLGASMIKPLLNDAVINNISAIGGVMIAALGFNLMGVTQIKVANLLPGIVFIPIVMLLFRYIPV